MTIHSDCQKLKEKKDFVPQGLIRRGAILLSTSKGGRKRSRDERDSAGTTDIEEAKRSTKQFKLSAADNSDPDSATQSGNKPIAFIMSLMTWCHKAFLTYIKPEGNAVQEARHPQATEMDIDDTDAKTGKKQAALFTLDEVYERLARKVLRILVSNERIETFAIVADKKRYVAREKEATQRKRSETKSKNPFLQPYPEATRITANGIQYAGIGKVDQPFSVQRLLATRSLREEFFISVCSRFQKDPRITQQGSSDVKILSESNTYDDDGKCLNGKLVLADARENPFRMIIDVCHDAPYEIAGNQVRPLPDMHWKKGEDDITIPLYCVALSKKGYQCIVRSIDRDLELILLLVAHRIPEQVILDMEDGRHMDIHANIEALKAAGWLLPMYVAAHILCGTDFVHKSDLTNQISVTDIFQATFALCGLKKIQDIHTNKDNLVLLLRMIYSHKLKSKSILTIDDIHDQCSGYKRLQFPSQAQLDVGFKAFQFNMRYWTSLQDFFVN